MRSDKDYVEKNASIVEARKWMDSQSSFQMLGLLDGMEARVAPRKIRLWGIECCRRIEGFMNDADCLRAIELCETLIANSTDETALIAFRQQLDDRRMRIIQRLERSRVDEWAIAAAMQLLQTDQEYFCDTGPVSLRNVGSMAMSAGVRTGREIEHISNVQQGDLDKAATIISSQADLLNEIVGNPFKPTDIDSNWLTRAVVSLATEHDRVPNRELMLKLYDALKQAGCNDVSILEHCLLSYQHTRGCWLIDLLLDHPTFVNPQLEWDYSISADGLSTYSLREIKRRLRDIASTEDGSLRCIQSQDGVAFAKWLEEQGFTSWSDFIRCAAEIREPSNSEAYANAVARYDTARSCCRYSIALPNVGMKTQELWPRWWSESHVNMDFGLPSAIDATVSGGGKQHSARLLDALTNAMRHLPVRDVNFSGDYFDELPQILSSPAGQAITTFRSEVIKKESGTEPFAVLKETGLNRTLKRLVLERWLDGSTVRELADMPFESLQELDFFEVCGVDCDAETLAYLTQQTWFQRLKSIRMNFRGDSCGVAMPLLSRLANLTTLAIADSTEEMFRHDVEGLSFPKLQRLYVCVDQIKSVTKNICSYSAPSLIEFWFASRNTIGKNLIELFNGELLQPITVLRLDTPKLNSKALDSLLAAPLAKNLRFLELHSMSTNGPSKKCKAIFADGESLPKLSSLALTGFYEKPNYADCAQWLHTLNCGVLRHLRLEECKLDDTSLQAILGNPVFRQLETLEISEGYGQSHVTPEGAERFLRSLDFPNLKSLGFHKTRIGDRIACLSDASCIPSVQFASFSDTVASPKVIENVKLARPNFVIQ